MEMTAKGADGMTEIPMSPPNPDARAPEVHAVEPPEDPLEKPMDGNILKLVKWALLYPLNLLAKLTIPGTYTIGFTTIRVPCIFSVS